MRNLYAGMRARSGARSRAGSVPSGRDDRNAPAPSMAGGEYPRREVGLDVPTWPEVLAREASHHFKPAQMVDSGTAQSMSVQRWVAMRRFEQRRALAGDAGAGSPFQLASTPPPRRTNLSSPSPACSPRLPATVVPRRMGRVRASVSSTFSVQAGQRAASSRSHRDGAGVGGSVSSVNVTIFSIHDFRPRPLARPGQPQLADW